MTILFIDTSSSDVSIALYKDNKIKSSITKNIPNEHSIYTVDFIDKVLKESGLKPNEIDKIMVVNGPGSFTGIRIGVTIAKTYAYLTKCEIICISSLKMRALSINNNYILSLINANHNNYYMGLYDKEYNEIIKEGFYKKEDVLKVIEKYNPEIVSNEDIFEEEIKTKKEELNIEKIIKYYNTFEGGNPHLANPNYLKLPQALEEQK